MATEALGMRILGPERLHDWLCIRKPQDGSWLLGQGCFDLLPSNLVGIVTSSKRARLRAPRSRSNHPSSAAQFQAVHHLLLCASVLLRTLRRMEKEVRACTHARHADSTAVVGHVGWDRRG